VKDLNVHYGKAQALENVSIHIHHGEFVSIVGLNGAGKTTLFNAITGSVKPSAGRVIFQGTDITGWRTYRIARIGIARTFQQIRLYDDLSVLENVMAAGHAYIHYSFLEAVVGLGRFSAEERQLKSRAEHVLELMGLVDICDEKAESLPYGRQRKLEIARALAMEPKLLLLDEPVAGMNPRETIEFGELLGKLHRDLNLTIGLIDHDMPFVMDICQRIKVIDHGVPIAWDTPEEIQRDERVIAAYLGEGNGA
jgi:branched-chain amino acid transport system ATP-binding protein